MQVLIIVVILRDENQVLLDSEEKVPRIGSPGYAGVCGQYYLVAGSAQSGGEGHLGNVVVEIEIYASGLKSLGA